MLLPPRKTSIYRRPFILPLTLLKLFCQISHLTEKSDSTLATFFKLWDNLSTDIPWLDGVITIAWTATGEFNSCAQFPSDWEGELIGSVSLGPGVAGCWVYPSTDCSGSFTPVDAGTTEGVIFDEIAGSFQCLSS
jgi:hypothetical protein